MYASSDYTLSRHDSNKILWNINRIWAATALRVCEKSKQSRRRKATKSDEKRREICEKVSKSSQRTHRTPNDLTSKYRTINFAFEMCAQKFSPVDRDNVQKSDEQSVVANWKSPGRRHANANWITKLKIWKINRHSIVVKQCRNWESRRW